MKQETMDLLVKNAEKTVEAYRSRGNKARIVYLPCVISYTAQGYMGGMDYPNISIIVRSENEDIGI